MTYSEKINALVDLGATNLTTWEMDFISDISDMLEVHGEDSLKDIQKDKIDEIYEKYVEEE